jgi:hypothetical protein
MQIERVDTMAGVATCWAPSRMAVTMSLPMAMLRCTFSTSTVASSTSMPTARASPPRVIELMVCPVDVQANNQRPSWPGGCWWRQSEYCASCPVRASIIRAVRPAAVHRFANYNVGHTVTHKHRLVDQNFNVAGRRHDLFYARQHLLDVFNYGKSRSCCHS